MKKISTTSLAIALGMGVMLSPAVAGAQEESAAQPGTEVPVESTGGEFENSENANVQPGTEVPEAEDEDASQSVDSTVQPGTEAPATEHAVKENNGGGQSQPGTEADTPVEEPAVEQPGTEAPKQPVVEAPGQEGVIEQVPSEPRDEPAENTAMVEFVPAAQQEEIELIAHEQPVEEEVSGQGEPAVHDVTEKAGQVEDVAAPEVLEQVAEEVPVVQEQSGIAGATLDAAGYGQSVSASVDIATSGVQVEVGGQAFESSTAKGVVVNDVQLLSEDLVLEANKASEKAVNALPEQVTNVTDAVYEGVQSELEDLPAQSSVDVAGASAELNVEHWA